MEGPAYSNQKALCSQRQTYSGHSPSDAAASHCKTPQDQEHHQPLPEYRDYEQQTAKRYGHSTPLHIDLDSLVPFRQHRTTPDTPERDPSPDRGPIATSSHEQVFKNEIALPPVVYPQRESPHYKPDPPSNERKYQETQHQQVGSSSTNDPHGTALAWPSPVCDATGRPRKSSSDASIPLRRKTRERGACEECRRRRVKCSRKEPCLNCKRRNQDCVYGLSAQKRTAATPITEELPLVGSAGTDHHQGEVLPGLGLRIDAIDDCLTSYEERVHNMLPFLDLADLRKGVGEFIARHISASLRSPHGVHDESNILWKRKYSFRRFEVPSEHAPTDAIIFLVLALGEACRYTDKLPSTRLGTHGEELFATTVPGLIFYRRAFEIIQVNASGTDLVHAQAYLLAGLYVGKLARVEDSRVWFAKAEDVLRVLLDRYKLCNEKPWTIWGNPSDLVKEINDSRARITNDLQRLILLAAWSYLELTNDFLHETPRSNGLHDVEDMLPLPQNFSRVHDHEIPSQNSIVNGGSLCTDPLMFFVGQIFLGRQLAQIHSQIYGQEDCICPLPCIQRVLRDQDLMLRGWRESLPSSLRWDDTNPPSASISAAQLRARYWTNRFSMNIPFLDFALHVSPYLEAGLSVREAASKGRLGALKQSDIRLLEAVAGMDVVEIEDGCQRCVEAAIESVVAFSGVPGRLVFPNIHSTAQA